MNRLMFPLMVLIILVAPFLGKKGSVEETERLWMTVYTYDLPLHELDEGDHTFQYEFNWTYPQQGSLIGEIHTIPVTASAPVYPGYALLRPTRIDALSGDANGALCSTVESVNPAQAMRFLVAWVPDNFFTAEEMNAQLSSMNVTVRWDGGAPVRMIPRRTSISWDALWNCDPWATQSLPSSENGIGMLLPGGLS